MGLAARARRSSRPSCAPTPRSWASTPTCWWRSTAPATSRDEEMGPQPLAAALPRRTQPRRSAAGRTAPGPPGPSPWSALAGVIVVGVPARALGLSAATRTSPERQGFEHAGDGTRAPRRRSRPRRSGAAVPPAWCAVTPTDATYACIDNGEGTAGGVRGHAGERADVQGRQRRLRSTSASAVDMRANGKAVSIPDSPEPVGYDFTRRARTRGGHHPLRVSGPAREARAPESSSPAPRCSPAGCQDRNGPWLSDRLMRAGHRPGPDHDLRRPARGHGGPAALPSESQGVDLIVTSGGLGPTADDLTLAVVAEFAGRPLALDEALEGRIADILDPLTKRWQNLDWDAVRAANRKQALVPEGATVIEPAGTAPGMVVPPRNGGPTMVVLPDPPRELHAMWREAVGDGGLQGGAGRRPRIPADDAAPVRHPRVRDRARRCARPRSRSRASASWRSPPACAGARWRW